jgi:hypothetical protein
VPKLQLPRVPLVAVTGTKAPPALHPPAPLDLTVKQQLLHSLGIAADLQTLAKAAFTLSAREPLVKNRGWLLFHSAHWVWGVGTATFHGATPDAALEVNLESQDKQRYLLDFSLGHLPSQGETLHLSCKPLGGGNTQTVELAPDSYHALFAVEVPAGGSGIQITCPDDYVFFGVEVTPLPNAGK